jgi:hypothetical protein
MHPRERGPQCQVCLPSPYPDVLAFADPVITAARRLMRESTPT